MAGKRRVRDSATAAARDAWPNPCGVTKNAKQRDGLLIKKRRQVSSGNGTEGLVQSVTRKGAFELIISRFSGRFNGA